MWLCCLCGPYAEGTLIGSNVFDQQCGWRDSRSPITTSGNVALVVHPQDSRAVFIHVRQIPRVTLRLVSHVSMRGVWTRVEIPFAAQIT